MSMKICNGMFAYLCWYCSSWIIQHFKQWFFFLFFIRIIYCFLCSLFIWFFGLCLLWVFCLLLTVNLISKEYYATQHLSVLSMYYIQMQCLTVIAAYRQACTFTYLYHNNQYVRTYLSIYYNLSVSSSVIFKHCVNT